MPDLQTATMAFRGKALPVVSVRRARPEEPVRRAVQAEGDLPALREVVGAVVREVEAVHEDREARRRELPHCGARSV
jgi:hypothetical protein